LSVGPCFERDASVLDVMSEVVQCAVRNTFEIIFRINIVCVNPSTNITVLILAIHGRFSEWRHRTVEENEGSVGAYRWVSRSEGSGFEPYHK